jgi:hypothetical protein
MTDDPIVAEVRRVREAHAARFNHDLDAIYQDIKRMERESGRTYVSFPPRRISAAEQEAARIRLQKMLEQEGKSLEAASAPESSNSNQYGKEIDGQ